jgi:flavodoxin I
LGPEVLIVYGSSKGRTGRIAGMVAEALGNAGCAVTLQNVFEARPEQLPDFRYVVLGSSTYGQGDLQQDFLDFERDMDHLDLTGIKAAVFGSGNSRYAYYAEAVDILEAKLKILNARLLVPSFRHDMMDGPPESTEAAEWAASLAAAILEDSRAGA